MTEPARPTVRCLFEDLADQWPGDIGVRLRAERLPPPSVPLDDLDHPLLAQARKQFATNVDYPTERIDQLDDRVWLKVKTNADRWRGAAHIDGGRPWVGAAGWREAGSRDDFYDELGRAARDRARGSHAAHRTDTSWLLPGELDNSRLRAEQQHRREYVQPVIDLQDLLKSAVHQQGTWHEIQIHGDQVRARVEGDDLGQLYLNLEPGPHGSVALAIETLLSPLSSGEWDLEKAEPDGRLTYFTLLDDDHLAAALAWRP